MLVTLEKRFTVEVGGEGTGHKIEKGTHSLQAADDFGCEVGGEDFGRGEIVFEEELLFA